jgi:hypothetical protein
LQYNTKEGKVKERTMDAKNVWKMLLVSAMVGVLLASGTAGAQGCVVFPGDGVTGPALSYTDNGDGTATDNNTLLIWEVKDNSGGIHDVGNEYSWNDAFTVFLTTLNTPPCFAGHCDWRLPNVKELQSIVDYSTITPAISSSFPGSTLVSFYWSSTTHAGLSSNAWFVSFSVGLVFPADKNTSLPVRAVRGGQ